MQGTLAEIMPEDFVNNLVKCVCVCVCPLSSYTVVPCYPPSRQVDKKTCKIIRAADLLPYQRNSNAG